MLSQDLATSLISLGSLLSGHCRHDWWIIGSAACAAHGVDPGIVRDIDVLLDVRDAPGLAAVLGLSVETGQPDDRFRSACFMTWPADLFPVEFMAGFELMEGETWTPVQIKSREQMGGVFVPSRAELKHLFQRFGRPKDLVRAALL